jgi:hypothetical protein
LPEGASLDVFRPCLQAGILYDMKKPQQCKDHAVCIRELRQLCALVKCVRSQGVKCQKQENEESINILARALARQLQTAAESNDSEHAP